MKTLPIAKMAKSKTVFQTASHFSARLSAWNAETLLHSQ
jgi:hypothetical protein